MKFIGQKTLLAVSVGAAAILVSSSVLAMPFCGNKYSKRNSDPYMMTYIPGHGGYSPMYRYGYHPMHYAPSPHGAPHMHETATSENTDKETAQVETKTY